MREYFPIDHTYRVGLRSYPVFRPHFPCQFANYGRHWWLGSTVSLAAHLCRGEVTALGL